MDSTILKRLLAGQEVEVVGIGTGPTGRRVLVRAARARVLLGDRLFGAVVGQLASIQVGTPAIFDPDAAADAREVVAQHHARQTDVLRELSVHAADRLADNESNVIAKARNVSVGTPFPSSEPPPWQHFSWQHVAE